MENSIIILPAGKGTQEFNLKPETDYNITVIDLNDAPVDSELNFKYGYKSTLKLQVTSLNMKDHTKRLCVHNYHQNDAGISDVNFYCVQQDSSNTFAKVLSIVDKHTNLNETYQNIRAINMDNESQFTGEPMLYVENNNIKAKHAMTVGQISVDELFYLMSRGITKKDAQKLVIMGHFKKILSLIAEEKQKEFLDYVEEKINKHGN